MSDRTMASADDFAMNEDDMECIARLLPMDDVSSAYPLVDLVDDDSTSTSTSQSCTLTCAPQPHTRFVPSLSSQRSLHAMESAEFARRHHDESQRYFFLLYLRQRVVAVALQSATMALPPQPRRVLCQREIRVAALVYLFQCFRPGDVIASLGVFAPCHSVTHSVYLRRIKTFPDLWDAKSKVLSSLSHALVNVEFDMGTNSISYNVITHVALKSRAEPGALVRPGWLQVYLQPRRVYRWQESFKCTYVGYQIGPMSISVTSIDAVAALTS